MKKSIDVTESVMKKVVRFETKRTGFWFMRFAVAVLCFGALFIGSIWIIWAAIVELRSLDLLEIFGEDQEIISQYWEDVVSIFWEELPQPVVITGAIVFVFFIIFLIWTKKRRRIMFQKMRQLASFAKKK